MGLPVSEYPWNLLLQQYQQHCQIQGQTFYSCLKKKKEKHYIDSLYSYIVFHIRRHFCHFLQIPMNNFSYMVIPTDVNKVLKYSAKA